MTRLRRIIWLLAFSTFWLAAIPSHATDWQTHAASLSYTNAISATAFALWVATDGAIIRWDTAARTYQLYTVPGTDLPARTYEHVRVDPNGDLWATAVEYGEANSIAEVFLTQLTGGKQWRHHDASDGVPAFMPNGDTLASSPSAPAYLVAMSKGRLLTATDKSLQEKVLLLGNPPPDLSDVAVDAGGGTWLALPGTGAAYLLGDDVTVYTTADGLCSNDVLAIAVAPSGAVWFATYGGGICRRDGNTWTAWTAATGLPSDYFRDIAIEPDGTVWSAPQDMGAVRFDGAAWQSFRVADGLPDDDVIGLAAHPQDGMFLATHDAGVAFYDGVSWQTFALAATIPSDATWAIATHEVAACPRTDTPHRDACNEIWLGTDAGVAHVSADAWTTYTAGANAPTSARRSFASAARHARPRPAEPEIPHLRDATDHGNRPHDRRLAAPTTHPGAVPVSHRPSGSSDPGDGSLSRRLVSYPHLEASYRLARRGKRLDPAAATFDLEREKELWALHEELSSRTYQPGPYRTFVVTDSKRRMISAAPFRDRVVHHALTSLLEPIFEPKFIFDSYACRKSNGTHAAVRRFQHFARAGENRTENDPPRCPAR